MKYKGSTNWLKIKDENSLIKVCNGIWHFDLLIIDIDGRLGTRRVVGTLFYWNTHIKNELIALKAKRKLS